MLRQFFSSAMKRALHRAHRQSRNLGNLVIVELPLVAQRDNLSILRPESSNGGLQLSAVLPDERVALTRTLAQALRVADGSGDALGEPLRLTRLSGAAPLLVVPVPLPPPAFSLWELSDTARLLVLVIDPNARNLAAAAALQAAFGLTTAEARVATLIGSGLSGPQAAQVLGVSPATVKTHLGRCFEKLGVRSQVELARMLSALPPDRANFDGRT